MSWVLTRSVHHYGDIYSMNKPADAERLIKALDDEKLIDQLRNRDILRFVEEPEEEEIEKEEDTTPSGTPIPEDFPGYEILTEGGYTTLESVIDATDEELLDLSGIGEKTLVEIRESIEEDDA